MNSTLKIEYPIAKYKIMIHLHSHSSSVIKPSQAMGATRTESEWWNSSGVWKYRLLLAQNRGTGKISFKKLTKGGAIYMGETIQLLTTADVRKLLKIGNKTCLELFHR